MNNPSSTWRHEIFIGSHCRQSSEGGCGEAGVPAWSPGGGPRRGPGGQDGLLTLAGCREPQSHMCLHLCIKNQRKKTLKFYFLSTAGNPPSVVGRVHPSASRAQPCSRSLLCSGSLFCRQAQFRTAPLGSRRPPLAGLALLPLILV